MKENDEQTIQNAPVSSPEAQEGQSGAEAGYEQGLQQNAYGEPEKGVVGELPGINLQNGQGKRLMKIAIVAAVLGVVALGVILIVSNLGKKDENGGNSANNGGQIIENGGDDEEEEKPKIVEISTKDQKVRELYENFNVIRQRPELMGFYTDERVQQGIVENEYMVAVAQGSLGEPEACKMEATKSNLKKRYPGVKDVEQTFEEKIKEGFFCYDGEKIREQAKALFGQAVSLEGEYPLSGWAYDEENDEVYETLDGNEEPEVEGDDKSVLERAEADSERIYLYEKLAEKQYKWTFKKTDGANYVFEKIEQIH